VIGDSKKLNRFRTEDSKMTTKMADQVVPADGTIDSRVTSHESRNWLILTFVAFSMILLCPATDAIAEDNRQRTYIRMEETDIVGEIEHPEITYIIPKTRIRFSQIPLERDFSSHATRLTNPLALETEVRVKTLLIGP
jgi:hypothetical protein